MTDPTDVSPASPPRLTTLSHGGGCACKLPIGALEQILSTLGREDDADLIVGAAEADDAAVLRLDGRRSMVVTLDFFTPILDDPAAWGSVAAANAMSDVYAMGGSPVLALNIVAWPLEALGLEMLRRVLDGGTRTARRAGCLVAGGHTIDDPEPKFGMAVVGFADTDRLLRIDAARPGDVLVLTKPLGTGAIASATKAGVAPPSALRASTASMTTLNDEARDLALALGVRAAVDVTGFGLLGHLLRLCTRSAVSAVVHPCAVAALPGAEELIRAGFVSGGTRNNLSHVAPHLRLDGELDEARRILLHDAQTSGGLLLCVPRDRADRLPEVLAGLPVTRIGELTDPGPEVSITLG